jgi:hypothetical protein
MDLPLWRFQKTLEFRLAGMLSVMGHGAPLLGILQHDPRNGGCVSKPEELMFPPSLQALGQHAKINKRKADTLRFTASKGRQANINKLTTAGKPERSALWLFAKRR